MRGATIRIGFVSTRLAGTDGVSLEVQKWAAVLTELGNECFYFAGESDRPPERTHLVEEAHFKHPDIQRLNGELFERRVRATATSNAVQSLSQHLKSRLQEFVGKFDLELLITQNALSLPMNVPLGIALAGLLAETDIPTIAHHHDFHWERARFAVSAAGDYLHMAFPPKLPSIRHVVINSIAARQLALRTGESSVLIPNVMDFDSPPPAPDEYGADLRSELEIPPGGRLVLQPTRVVPRKRIEVAIELTRRLGPDCILVISHASGDEGQEYQRYLQDYAELLGVGVVFASERVDHGRGRIANDQKVYSLGDLYHQADLVTYPSAIEGFGNALIEAVYYRRPIVVNAYEVFRTDIRPKGFEVIEFSDFITAEIVQEARRILDNPEEFQGTLEHNFEIGRRYHSFRTLERCLAELLSEEFISPGL